MILPLEYRALAASQAVIDKIASDIKNKPKEIGLFGNYGIRLQVSDLYPFTMEDGTVVHGVVFDGGNLTFLVDKK